MKTGGIYRMDHCGRRANWQNHSEGDECQIAIEQDRAVDGRQRSEFFDDAFDLREQRIAEEAAERRNHRLWLLIRMSGTSSAPMA